MPPFGGQHVDRYHGRESKRMDVKFQVEQAQEDASGGLMEKPLKQQVHKKYYTELI